MASWVHDLHGTTAFERFLGAMLQTQPLHLAESCLCSPSTAHFSVLYNWVRDATLHQHVMMDPLGASDNDFLPCAFGEDYASSTQ